jgi:hypothetical protein
MSDRYESGIRLHGVIYFHRISDGRMGGVSARTIRVLKEFCGNRSLKNVMIVTTMWSQPTSEVETEHETQLRDMYFKPLLDGRAVLHRHDNTFDTASQIVRKISCNDPEALRIQIETVKEKKRLRWTSAGIILHSQLLEFADKIQDSIESTLRMVARVKEDRNLIWEHSAFPLLARHRNEIKNLETVAVAEDIDVSKEWEGMELSSVKITTLLRRCYGKDDTPGHTAFWVAMGDTTSIIGQIYDIFQQHPLESFVKEKLLDINSILTPYETTTFEQWLAINGAAVKEMETIMKTAIITCVSRNKKRRTLPLYR